MNNLSTVNSSIKSRWGAYLFQADLRGGGGAYLNNVEIMMVSVLHKELEAQEQEVWKSCSRWSESNPNFQLVNKQSRISAHEVLQS